MSRYRLRSRSKVVYDTSYLWIWVPTMKRIPPTEGMLLYGSKSHFGKALRRLQSQVYEKHPSNGRKDSMLTKFQYLQYCKVMSKRSWRYGSRSKLIMQSLSSLSGEYLYQVRKGSLQWKVMARTWFCCPIFFSRWPWRYGSRSKVIHITLTSIQTQSNYKAVLWFKLSILQHEVCENLW